MSLRLPLAETGTSAINLGAGQVWTIPQGRFSINTGRFASVQRFDPVSCVWLPTVGSNGADLLQVVSDGENFRVANQTSCPVAAIVTAGGSGYTSPPTVTPSEGKSVWQAILGPNLTSVAIRRGGKNYKYPPLVVIAAPPYPGYPATAVATIAAGAVTAVALNNQGAGYKRPPAISVINDPRDNTGSGCVLDPVMGNGGAVTGVACCDHSGGVIVTSGTVPTLAFAGGGGTGAAATAIMCWSVASITISTPGAGYDGVGSGAGGTGFVGVKGYGSGIDRTAAAFSNARFEGGAAMLRTRVPDLLFQTNSVGSLTLNIGGDPGIIGGDLATAIDLKIASNKAPTTVAVLSIVPGGQSDVVYVLAE